MTELSPLNLAWSEAAIDADRAGDLRPPFEDLLARGKDTLGDDTAGPLTAACWTLMAVGHQRQQFTLTHLESLLAQAGFVDIECHSTSPLYWVVARKP